MHLRAGVVTCLHYGDPMLTVYVGDAREVMAGMEPASVQCVVTSPPYWGLRDYGEAGQLGLEPTPEAYVESMVAVFREVRRVLRSDGTVWLNLGDSYVANGSGQDPQTKSHKGSGLAGPNRNGRTGLKAKDRLLMPARVALALQQPYYTGTIRDERDRIWLAAMIDAEGCMFIHKRKAGQPNGQGHVRLNATYGAGLEVSNTSLAIIERCMSIVGRGSISVDEAGTHNRKQTLYRWSMRSNECRDVVREVYPYLVGKQQQARVLIGCPSSGDLAEAAHGALIGLHHGTPSNVDFPAPAPMFEQGWWLRDEIVWGKSNPMPSSVTDRTTPAHEMVYLLTKSARYAYDAAAIAEPAGKGAAGSAFTEGKTGVNGMGRQQSAASRRQKVPGGWDIEPGAHGTKHRQGRTAATYRAKTAADPNARGLRQAPEPGEPNAFSTGPNGEPTRNKRSVWTIATQPYAEAHFATFPEKLVEPMILAGCPPGGVVLDPFGGSGTVAMVANRLGRRAVHIDLSDEYIEQAIKRIASSRAAGEGPAIDMPVPFADDGLWAS